MTEHLNPDDETITGDRPAVDDDTEGHRRLDEQPGMRAAGEQPDFRQKQDEDDTEGHRRG